MTLKKWIGNIPVPAWMYLMGAAVFHELVLHFWVVDSPMFGRVAAIACFALGLGGLVGLLISFLPGKAQKWVTFTLGILMAVLYLMEYFIDDAYQYFMTFETIAAGAGGVATGFAGTVFALLGKNLWRIGVMALPVTLFGVFARCEKPGWSQRGLYSKNKKSGWKQRCVIAAATVVAYLLAAGSVFGLTNDKGLFNNTYNFDRACRSFGLHVGFILEGIHGQVSPDTLLEVPVQTQPTEETQAQTEATEAVEVTEPIVYEDNVLPLDYAALAQEDPKVADIHNYVAAQVPSSQNQFTGLFEGKNLIFITAEALSKQAIREDLTPTLYRLMTEGIYFTEFYQPLWGGGTAAGEYSNLTGLMPANGAESAYNAMDNEMFLLPGKQLQKLGYITMAYHNNDFNYYGRKYTHPYLGYDQFIGYGNGMEKGVTDQWPQSDLEMMEFTIPQLLQTQPFHAYYMSVSGHSSYYPQANAMVRKNIDLVSHLTDDELIKGYYACNLEFEFAMKYILDALEEAGALENTVIVISPDHYPYGLGRSDTWGSGKDLVEDLYGHPITDNFTRDQNALIIWSPCLEDMDLVVDTPTYSLDILPTLSNLFGWEYDSRLLVGRDVFSEQEPLTLWPDYSWKTDKGSFDAITQTFTPAEGVTVEEGYVEYIQSLVAAKIAFCKAVQNKNYYTYLAKRLVGGEQ